MWHARGCVGQPGGMIHIEILLSIVYVHTQPHKLCFDAQGTVTPNCFPPNTESYRAPLSDLPMTVRGTLLVFACTQPCVYWSTIDWAEMVRKLDHVSSSVFCDTFDSSSSLSLHVTTASTTLCACEDDFVNSIWHKNAQN